MGRVKGLWFLITLLLGFTNHLVAEEKPDFCETGNNLNLNFFVGEPVNLDMKELLCQGADQELKWAAVPPSNIPDWVDEDEIKNGFIKGTPTFRNPSPTPFTLFVTNGDDLGSNRQTRLFVKKRPRFLQNPIDLGFATEEKAFNFALNQPSLIDNPENYSLTFTLENTPAWMTFQSDGTIGGTPQDGDNGKYSGVIVKATYADGEISTTAKGEVLNLNKPPVCNNNPTTLPNGQEDNPYTVDLNDFVSDPDNDPIRFEKDQVPAWLSLTNSGILSGNPGNDEEGPHVLKIRITDAIAGSNTCTMNLQVNPTNHPPIWDADPINLGNAFEDSEFTYNLRQHATDEDGDPLTFRKVSGPSWWTVSLNGEIKGTPGKNDIGNFNGVVEVSDGEFKPTTGVIGVVIHVNHAPEWTQDPINLPSATEDVAYSQNIGNFATDVDLPKDTLTITKVQGPDWVTISSTGQVSGTPRREDQGLNSISVKVTDKEGLSDTATVRITVNLVNKPPLWLNDPIDLGKALEDSNFNFDLNPHVKDPDGDQLTFGKVSGPDWLQVAPNGILSGIPGKDDVGDFTAKFRVSDGEFIVEVNAFGEVVHVNHPPSWVKDPIILDPVDEQVPFSTSIAGWATDPDPNDTLTFTKVDGPSWISVASDGGISGTPPNEGDYSFRVQVQDQGGLTAEKPVTVQLKVNRVNHPPVWQEDPVQLGKILEGTNFQLDLKTKVVDQDGDPLTFKMFGAPAWLTITPQGIVAGSPGENDIGPFTATFEVSDGEFNPQAGGVGEVIAKNKPPEVDNSKLKFVVNERVPFNFNLNDVISDPEGETLSYSLKETPDWVTVTSSGELSVNARFEHISPPVHRFTLLVKDQEFTVEGILEITVLRNPRPPEWTQQTIRFTTTVNQVFQEDLSRFVSDPDGLAISISKLSGPDWLSVQANGQITGIPRADNLGDNSFDIRASNTDPSSADVKLIITVVTDNDPPYWTKDPINLPGGKPGVAYTQRVDEYAKDPNNDPLTFRKISGPDWAFVTTGGLIIGTPKNSDGGKNEIKIRVTDPGGLFADATAVININDPNTCPTWLNDPIPLGDIPIDKVFSFDLRQYVNDPDQSQNLNFAKVTGPAWLEIAVEGQLAGIPRVTDLGNFTAVVSVTDGICAPVQVGAVGRVISPVENRPPVIESIMFTVTEGTVENKDLVALNLVSDPDGDPMTFALIDAEPWVAVSSDGKLVMAPQAQQIGDHVFTLEVKDNQNNTTRGPINIKVVPDGNILPPVWTTNPIFMKVKAETPITGSLAAYAMDPNNPELIPLTFAKDAGDAWLNVSSNGTLTGVPPVSSIGQRVFPVRVTNTAGLFSLATLIIDVEDGGGTHTDERQVDEAVPGALAENVWVLDNTCRSASLMRALASSINVFFDKLDDAQIHYTQIMLGSAGSYNGNAVSGSNGSKLIKWNDGNVANEFVRRLNRIGGVFCKNSPIWSMFKFYGRAPNESFYQNGFFTRGVPNDAMIVSQQLDYYKYYSRFTSQRNWTSSDYARNFMQFHDNVEQPYTVSALAPKCSSGAHGEPVLYPVSGLDIDPPNNAYGNIVKMTKGKYWPACKIPVSQVMREYADHVIFRAYATAKKKIKLTHTPSNPSQIVVKIGTRTLQNPSQWRYLSGSNEVQLFWENIDLSLIFPGDKITIEYDY